MADISQLYEALRRADAAGNTADAQALAQAIKSQSAPAPQAPIAATPTDTSQPSVMDRVIASPLGRFAQENVIAPVIGLGTMASHAFTNDPRVDTIQNAETGGYEAALARNRNTPGYAEAAAKLAPMTDKMANDPLGGPTEALTSSLQSTIGGIAGLPGGLDASNAMADAAAARTSKFNKDHPYASTALQLAGGLAAAPDGGAKTVAAPLAKIPTVSQLKDTARAAYKAADQSGLIISGDAVKGMVSNVEADLASKGFDANLHPKTLSVVKRLQAVADDGTGNPQNVTLQGMEVLRKVAGQATQNMDKADKFMSRVVQDHIDNLMENLGPNDVVGKPDPAAINSLADARDAWKRAAKGEQIDSLISKAKLNAPNFSASGYENALRTQFRKLANSDRGMARFSPAEQEAIRRVAKGGPIENSLRMLGKFSPHGVVSTAMGMGTGFAVGGPAGAAALPILGGLSRVGATALTARNANAVSELVRNGGPLSKAISLLPQVTKGSPPVPLGLLAQLLEQQQQQPQSGLLMAQ